MGTVRQEFEQLKVAARVRWIEKEGTFEVRCSGRASDPCTEASVQFLEAVVRELPHVRLILDEDEEKALRALGCRWVSTDAWEDRHPLDRPHRGSTHTWQIPPGVDVRRLRKDVFYLGHYLLTAGDPSITAASMPRGTSIPELAARTRIDFCLSSDADDDSWMLWLRPEPQGGSSSDKEEAAG